MRGPGNAFGDFARFRFRHVQDDPVVPKFRGINIDGGISFAPIEVRVLLRRHLQCANSINVRPRSFCERRELMPRKFFRPDWTP